MHTQQPGYRNRRGLALREISDWVNPLRSPALLVSIAMTTVMEVGQHDAWYTIAGLLLINQFCICLVTWLIGEVAIALLVTSDEWRGVLSANRLSRHPSAGQKSIEDQGKQWSEHQLAPAPKGQEERGQTPLSRVGATLATGVRRAEGSTSPVNH